MYGIEIHFPSSPLNFQAWKGHSRQSPMTRPPAAKLAPRWGQYASRTWTDPFSSLNTARFWPVQVKESGLATDYRMVTVVLTCCWLSETDLAISCIILELAFERLSVRTTIHSFLCSSSFFLFDTNLLNQKLSHKLRCIRSSQDCRGVQWLLFCLR